MTDRELMQQALEALENTTPTGFNMESDKRFYAVITALRERLAQPEQCQCPECQITPHASDCAVHNEPAYPKGACNCGAQPEQEPVALEAVYETIIQWDEGGGKRSRRELARRIVALYTTPPQRKPLTDEEIREIADKHLFYQPEGYEVSGVFALARAIEAALGIKGQA